MFTKRIDELEVHKEKLYSDLKESRRLYQKRQEVACLVNSIDLQYKWKLEKLMMRQEENEKRHAKSLAKFVWFIIFYFMIFATLVVFIYNVL